MNFIFIDRRGWPGAVLFLILAAIVALIWLPLTLFFLFLLAFQVFFFRDPRRSIPVGSSIVSPADGKIVEICSKCEDRFLGGNALKIGIFLSLFDVHVNRAPMSGNVRYIEHVTGKFINALKSSSVDANESHWMGLESGNRRVLVRQIAGTIARRIYCDARLGQAVDRGQKFGVICYGSRVEIFLPEGFRARVSVGEKVRAGESILGEFHP